ncbi:DUF6167 family protein [Nocardioides massiliensis]|uniref:Secreted protein n=1 Tax=Nocardioides massiliensis TaxID=1325935 RepID=A0ABT9NQX5_9ACTN|nr:DUF6167 family protein [Nocardioides massiliensis]MDP9822831.1 hypothetical protein [Nocardioides massiliensis]
MSRAAWFLAGAGAGVYALTKARRAAEAFTPDGMRDRVNGLFAGARVLVEEFQTGRDEAETDLRTRIDDRMLAITAADPVDDLPAPAARALHAVPPPSEHLPNPTPDKKGTHR